MAANDQPGFSTADPLSGYDAAAMGRLLSSSFSLMRNECTDADWLQQLCLLTTADGASCIRWLPGNRKQQRISATGAAPHLGAAWQLWLETLHAQSSLPASCLLDEITATSISTPCPFADPHTLTALLDCEPSLLVIAITRSTEGPAWSPADRDRYRALLPLLRNSVQLHKYLDGYRHVATITSAVLNTSPRGLILLDTAGKVLSTNRAADNILSRKDGLALSNGRLQLHSPRIRDEVAQVLADMPGFDAAAVPDRQWHWAIERNPGQTCYQLSLQTICLPEWNIESRASDRVALLSVRDLQANGRPTDVQLRTYFNLTAAQARLALALYGGAGIGDAAASLNISINTARSHLRNIYEKIGVRTYAEFMSKLTATVANYPAEP